MKELGSVVDLEDGACRIFDADSSSWLVVRKDGVLYGFRNECGHLPARIDRATLEAGCVRCPHHGCTFELGTGAVQDNRGYKNVEPLQPQTVVERDGVAWLDEG